MNTLMDILDVKQMMQVKGGTNADDIICRDGAVGVQCTGSPAVASQDDVTP